MWREAKFRDLVAKLTQTEVDKFKASNEFKSDADPAADILELTAESVRGFCRSNKQLKMCPKPHTIPEGLMTFAMDFAVYDLLKRINIVPNEARTKAWESAKELFKDVATGAFIPESWEEGGKEDDTDSNRAIPKFGVPKVKLLNKYPMI